MKHFVFVVAIWLSLSGSAHAALEEKTWKGLSDEFQIGYLWGVLDATVSKIWDHGPPGKEVTSRKEAEVQFYLRDAIETRIAECIKTRIKSPMQFQAMLADSMRQKNPEPGDSIYGIAAHLIWTTCVFPP